MLSSAKRSSLSLEEKRRWADDKFRLAVESAPHGMVVVDDLGQIVLVNAQVEKMFGYVRDRLWGQPIEILVPDRFRPKHRGYREQFVTEPTVRAMGVGRDLYGRRQDSTEFPVEIGLTPVVTETGTFVIGAIVDITERKRAEERFRLVVESAPNAMVMSNAEGTIVLVNAQTEKLFGYDRKELLGQSIETLVPDRFRTRHPDYRRQFFAEPQARAMGAGRELYGRRKDGSEFPVEIGLNPVHAGDGLMVLSAIVDITERKRAELELRKAHEELENRVQERTLDLAKLAVRLRSQGELIDLAHDAIIVRTLDGTIVFWNRGAETLYGWSKTEIVGQSAHATLRTRFPRPLADIEQEFLKAGHWEGTLEHSHKNGTWLTVATRWTLKPGEIGQPTSVMEINSDVTDKVKAEAQAISFAEELKRRNEELGAANKELEAFSYSVSHDLRAPLRAIDGFSRIIVKQFADKIPAEAKEHLQSVRANTARMGQLVDDLLAFSRLGRQAIRLEPVSSVALIRQCISELTPQLTDRSVDIRVPELPTVRADASLLKQVWVNLISNALKYSRKTSAAVVEIGTRTGDDPGRTTFFVRDNGVGFDMRYANKLFGVFQRLHRAEDYEGTGVGLAIVQRIVARHGGRIWADARPNDGATFFFTLEPSEPQ